MSHRQIYHGKSLCLTVTYANSIAIIAKNIKETK